jgi:cell division transport system ATP-binding protein
MITLTEVTKKFGSVTAVDHVSFAINEGEFLFITGPSGSGKTTIVRLLLREIQPTSGKVKVLGKALEKLKGKEVVELRRAIGVVWQDFRLVKDLTVFENVALALRVQQVPGAEIKTRVNETLEGVGLKGRENFFPAELAGGELQRCCFARALVVKPKILMADEPTGNLDPETSWQIMKLLTEANKQGATVLMATHNTEIVNSMRQRVIHLDAGRVVKDEQKGKYGK